MIDVDAELDLTPGARDQVFLDSAGSSLPPRTVVDAVVGHLRREAEVGGYRAAAERAEELAELPLALARLLGCGPEEIALTDSATRSWTQLVSAIRWRPGDRVLICGNEYAGNAIPLLQRARYDGVVVEVVPDDGHGDPDPDAFAAMLDDRVRLVSLVHVATNSGHVTRFEPIAAAARAAGALVLLDACQSAGQLALDVDRLGVDALTGTGRKWLRGPRGTGFLQVRPDVVAALEPAAADLRGGTWISGAGGTGATSYELRNDAARFELWEHDVAGRLGLKAAVDHLLALGPAEVEAAVRASATLLRDGLAGLAGVTVHDVGEDLAGIVTFTVDGQDPVETKELLSAADVTVSVSDASSTRIDMTARGLASVVRASPHYFVSESHLDRAVAAVAELAESS